MLPTLKQAPLGIKRRYIVYVSFPVRGKCVLCGRVFEWGVCVPPMRPLNNPFLGEKGRAAFGPTGKRAAAFHMGEALNLLLCCSYVAQAEPRHSFSDIKPLIFLPCICDRAVCLHPVQREEAGTTNGRCFCRVNVCILPVHFSNTTFDVF